MLLRVKVAKTIVLTEEIMYLFYKFFNLYHKMEQRCINFATENEKKHTL